MKNLNILFVLLIMPNILFADRFITNGKVVYDSETKMTWQGKPSDKQFNWSSAKSYCKNLNYGGFKDWELPSIYALESLIDYDKRPTIATNLIKIQSSWYWSSTEYKDSSSASAWSVGFDNGYDSYYSMSNSRCVLCVRGQ